MFDSSIGAASVLMPYGGKYQLTETQAMVAKVPVPDGKTNTVTMMSYGFDPYVSSWSPYHGAVYAVTESLSCIVAVGGDYSKVRFTFQEYFRRMTEDPHRWSQPFAALLGAYDAQISLRPAVYRRKKTVCPVPSTISMYRRHSYPSAVDVAKIKRCSISGAEKHRRQTRVDPPSSRRTSASRVRRRHGNLQKTA